MLKKESNKKKISPANQDMADVASSPQSQKSHAHDDEGGHSLGCLFKQIGSVEAQQAQLEQGFSYWGKEIDDMKMKLEKMQLDHQHELLKQSD